MNILLWILQIALALHTLMGAAWKFSNSEQAVPSLEAIPHGLWLSLAVIEILCSVCLVLPAFKKRFGNLVPLAAAFIVVEMLLFCVVHSLSGKGNISQVIYWLVVAVLSTFIAYGRFRLKPIKP